MKPKILALAFVAFVLLFACGKKTSSASSGKEETSAEMFTIEYYIPGDPGKDWDAWEAEINKMAADNISMQVNFNKVGWGDYATKLNTLISAGERIDAAMTFTDIIPYKAFMQRGAFADISQLLPEQAPDLYRLYTPEQWGAMTVAGEIGALPIFNAFNSGLRWHKQEADKYGFSDRVADIRDYEALEPILEEYLEKSGNAGFTDPGRWFLGAFYYVPILTDRISPWVVEPDDANMQVKNLYALPDMVANYRRIRQWNLNGWVLSPDSEGFDRVGSGEYPDWLVMPQVHKPDIPYNEYLPNKRDGGLINFYSVQSIYPQVLVPDFYHGVMANGEDTTKTLKMMEFIFTNKDVLATIQWGVKGKSWNENGVFAKLAESPEYTRHLWEFKLWGNPANTLKQGSPEDLVQQERNALASAVVPTIASFSADIRPIRTEIAAISNITKEYNDQLLFGLRDTDELLAELQQRLDDAGYEKVRAELQKQIDDWKTN